MGTSGRILCTLLQLLHVLSVGLGFFTIRFDLKIVSIRRSSALDPIAHVRNTYRSFTVARQFLLPVRLSLFPIFELVLLFGFVDVVQVIAI